jgi:hypothetical protein
MVCNSKAKSPEKNYGLGLLLDLQLQPVEWPI